MTKLSKHWWMVSRLARKTLLMQQAAYLWQCGSMTASFRRWHSKGGNGSLCLGVLRRPAPCFLQSRKVLSICPIREMELTASIAEAASFKLANASPFSWDDLALSCWNGGKIKGCAKVIGKFGSSGNVETHPYLTVPDRAIH